MTYPIFGFRVQGHRFFGCVGFCFSSGFLDAGLGFRDVA